MINLPEIETDNFAGGGGASTAIRMATGREVDIAVNHDPEALGMHAANHPATRHFIEDVWAVDPRAATVGRRVGLAWFSPDCKDHSKAKGGRPRSKKIRGLAWVVQKWAGTVRPRIIMLENVEEFQEWGPLVAKRDKATGRVVKRDGTVAGIGERVPVWDQQLIRCGRNLGRIFKRFVRALRELGYAVDWRELKACDYGAPTIRKRLFLVARCDGNPIVWPEPTHGSPKAEAVKAGRLLPWRTAAECIDWGLACPSIFERKRPLAEATMRRIARGIGKFVLESSTPFIVKVNHGGEQFRGQPLSEPLQTLTGKLGYGIAVPHVTKFRAGAVGSPVDEPLHTITAGGEQARPGTGNGMGLVSATLVQSGYGEREGQAPRVLNIEAPLGTVVGGGVKHAVVETTLAPVLTECANGSSQRVFDAAEPLRTQCAEVKGGHFAVATATLVSRQFGASVGHGTDEPMATVTAGGMGKSALVSAFLAKHYGGNETPGSGLAKPCDTITAVDHHALVTAQIVGCGGRMGQSPPRGVEEPAQTITAKADGCLVTSHLSKLYGTTTGQDLKEPMATVTGGGNHFAEVRAFLIKYYGNEKNAVDIAEPMHTVTAKDRIGLVTIEGEEYQITDIGMRMLEPHELYRAQGFPADYVIDRTHTGKKLPKHAQVRMCGNSVSPFPAAALVKANYVPALPPPFMPN